MTKRYPPTNAMSNIFLSYIQIILLIPQIMCLQIYKISPILFQLYFILLFQQK